MRRIKKVGCDLGAYARDGVADSGCGVLMILEPVCSSRFALGECDS
jgi:hypothetical protein